MKNLNLTFLFSALLASPLVVACAADSTDGADLGTPSTELPGFVREAKADGSVRYSWRESCANLADGTYISDIFFSTNHGQITQEHCSNHRSRKYWTEITTNSAITWGEDQYGKFFIFADAEEQECRLPPDRHMSMDCSPPEEFGDARVYYAWYPDDNAFSVWMRGVTASTAIYGQ